MKLMEIFKETTRKLAARSPGNDDKVSIACFAHKLKIEYVKRRLARSENGARLL